MIFASRADFCHWLLENAETSDGVWLIYGKTKDVVTLTVNNTLEEALCFGWIDGQLKRIDDTRYRKYFTRRQTKNNWSNKNKKVVDKLCEKKRKTDLGEKAIAAAKKNGTWNAPKRPQIT